MSSNLAFAPSTRTAFNRAIAPQKARETRRNVILPGRMRSSGDWVDVTICNVSCRGLMAKSTRAPARGEYLEIRYRGSAIVGRVMWSQGMRFGIRTQDKIDFAALTSEPHYNPRHGNKERRIRPRPTLVRVKPETSVSASGASRQLGRKIEWTIVAIAVAAAALVLGEAVFSVLRDPFAKVTSAL